MEVSRVKINVLSKELKTYRQYLLGSGHSPVSYLRIAPPTTGRRTENFRTRISKAVSRNAADELVRSMNNHISLSKEGVGKINVNAGALRTKTVAFSTDWK